MKIDKIANISSGGTPSRKVTNYFNGNIPWVKTGELKHKYIYDTEEHITLEAVSNSSAKIFPKDTLLIAMYGATIGRSSILKKDAACNQACCAIIPIINYTVTEYLFYVFNYRCNRLVSLGDGGAQPNISQSLIKLFEVPLPPLPEQKKIAEILSTVDEALEKTNAIIEETKQLKKGLMQKLFTEGIGHTRFKETKIGRIPEEWEVKLLHEIMLFKNGKAHEKHIVSRGKYIVINSKFISSGGRVRKYTNDNLCPLYKDEIVMVMSDVPNGKAIAKCLLILERDKYTLNQRICSLKSKNDNSLFLYYLLNRNKYFLKFDNGLEQTNLRKNDILECPLPIPPLTEQARIANILSQVDAKIETEETTKVELEQLKKGLMQVLLTGQVRVKV